MKRRAQAAMEFLMTYGWAILVVLIVVGALAYFGVLDPTKLLPDKCSFPAGFYCTDHRVTQDEISFLLQNGLGKDLNITGIQALETSGLHVCENTSDVIVPNGGYQTFVLNCPTTKSVTVGRKYKYDLNLTYKFVASTAFDHTMEGELFTKVEN